MTRTKALAVALGLVAVFVASRPFFQAHAAGQRGQRGGGGMAAKPAGPPAFLAGPLPPADKAYGVIDGKHLWQYVREQADIAERYRDQGHPQYWGRIAGTSGDVDDAQWLLKKYQQIGLTDTHIQDVALYEPQWMPAGWEVTASAGGKTVPLSSAQPPYGTPSTEGKTLDVPAVYVGLGSDADFAGRDVRGKAVLYFRATMGYNIGPADIVKRAVDKGAAAIFASDMRGGNLKLQSYKTASTVPIFQIGTEDAVVLRDMIAQAPADAPPHVKIRLDAKWELGQKSFLVWGTLPGTTDETIYVVAHRDGFFDAAGDNASGVATMLGVAEYFAKVPQSQRRRTMIFIGTDGHHQISPGWYGAVWLAKNRDRFFAKTALLINGEHPSQVLTHNMAMGSTETIIPLAWYAGGSLRPQLGKIAYDAFRELGVPLWTQPSQNPPGGDAAPFSWFVPAVVAQSNDFMYMHSEADTPDTISWSGLENVTRAYAKIVDEVNKLLLTDLQRAPEADPTTRYAPFDCPAWVKDSAVACKPKS